MSYYEAQSWQLPMRPSSWDQPPPPSSSSTSSTIQREEHSSFDMQMEEIDRALDNLSKSGKLPFGRRSGMVGMPQHRHSVGDRESMHSHSGSNLQNFYASQRHQSRPNDAEQLMQAKRRMAAQRERELRNYHQEQQYNRMSSQNKSDRAISPNTMNDEDRRELIARQHRALYGNENGSLYEGSRPSDDSQTPRPGDQSAGPLGSVSGRQGASPRTFDPYAMGPNQTQASIADAANQAAGNDQGQQNTSSGPSPKPQQQQQRSRTNSNSSPASNNNQNFTLFESGAQQSSRTSTSSPGDASPHTGKPSGPNSTGVAPIGTRPTQNQAINPALSKRATTPLPSPLSYGFAPNESLSANGNNNSNNNNNTNERSTSAASNPSSGNKESGLAWGSSSGVWGNKNPLGVQASVWG